jgi:hypothetical protein
MIDSILTSVKKYLGFEEEYTVFDEDIIMHINNVFNTLTQIGCGPEEGFVIADASTTWDDYNPGNPTKNLTVINMVKEYMFLKVKMIFDPPSSSAVSQAYENKAAECEWRIRIECDPAEE